MPVEFKEGDVVRLKPGGEPMTIISISTESISCMWWDWNNGEYARAVFSPETLIHIPKEAYDAS